MNNKLNQRVLIVANWKCNPSTQREAERLFNEIRKGVKGIRDIEIVISSPFIFLPILLEKVFKKTKKKSILKIGAQNCFWENLGPFTGEISPLMLKNLGVEYVILGHSERKKYFKETMS